jgi:peptidoglycan/LPS O-acetylase OafA/YrhL
MWCVRCYEPVRHLTPRAPQLPSFDVHEPPAEPRTSRWHAGPTTFGPVGRIVTTAIVLAFAPWHGLTGFGDPLAALTLWWLLGWAAMATLVLRHVWRRERVVETPGRTPLSVREAMARRFPRLGRSIEVPRVVVATAVGLVLLVAVVVIWSTSDASGRYYVVAVGVAAATGAFLAAWNEI